MKTLGNVIWICFFGGLLTWLLWLLACGFAFISIVGIPWGRACWNISALAGAPFGKEVINRHELTQNRDVGTSLLGGIGNIVWFIVIGVWLAIGHTIAGVACCLTILGIPFGLQHFKLAGLALWPIGKSIVTKALADEARIANARSDLKKIRSGTAI